MRSIGLTLVLGFSALGCSSSPAHDDAPGAGAGAGSAAGQPASVAPIQGASAGGAGAISRPAASLDAAVSSPARDAATAPPAASAPDAGGSAPLAPADAATIDAGRASEPLTCPASALAPGDHRGSVQFESHDRTYVMHVPQSYAGDEPVPVVFDFHGYGSSGMGQMGASGFRELSDAHGFVAVYPDGVGASWHVNGCCGQAAQEQLDEIGAVRAIFADVSEQVCVDRSRVYASGISQGGGMAHHVACLAADLFAAVAPVSSDLRTDPCVPARPISELSVRGTADTLSAYEGGPVGPVGMQYQSIGAKPTLERWRMIDQCTGAPETTLELCETYEHCAGGAEVSLCTIPGAGHVLYTNPANFDVAQAAWEMFERHQL